MGAKRIDFGIAAFVLGRNVRNVISQLNKFGAAIVRLFDDAFPRFGDVMLEADDIFETKCTAILGGQFHCLVIH
jgi:hypothetical protein